MCLQRHLKVKGHRGFTLVELTVAMAVITGLILTLISVMTASTEHLKSAMVAQQYRILSRAVAAYMGRHHVALARLPAACDQVALKAQAVPSASNLACQLQGTTGQTVANGLQPTVAELKALNLLEDTYSDKLSWSVKTVMQMPDGQFAAPVLAIQISKICEVSDACSNGYRLQGLVFNQQPYDFEKPTQHHSSRTSVMDAFMALGGGGAIAMALTSQDSAELLGYQHQFQMRNPLRSAQGGVPGVLALRSDFQSLTGVSSSDSLGAYQSGGQMWDFSGQSLRGLTSMAASSVGAATVQAVHLTVHGDLRLPMANAGDPCQVQSQSLATFNDGSGRLLVCPSSGAWALYKP